ncbi:MAG: hypothetical protein ACERKT_06045 [Acidobacteriota bacterium]|jgi:hypothetical protein
MDEPFTEVLAGGHRNSLGRTGEVVTEVLADRARLEELFAALRSPDELVRMRAGDALEKACRERPEWFAPHADRILTEVGGIDQPSVQWHSAQMLQHLGQGLDAGQRDRATALVRGYLTDSDDWIVLNTAMAVLADWSATDPGLARWLLPELEHLSHDRRKSVAGRAARLGAGLQDPAPD